MNDFTKEELKLLFDSLISLAYNPEPDILQPLKDKLYNMIDSYCEQHENDGYSYYKSGIKCTDFLMYASHDIACFLKCVKCGKLYQ